LQPGSGSCIINACRTVTLSASGGTEVLTNRAVIGCRGADGGMDQLGDVLNRPEALNRTSTQPLLTYSP
jgi:hypothetical protein